MFNKLYVESFDVKVSSVNNSLLDEDNLAYSQYLTSDKLNGYTFTYSGISVDRSWRIKHRDSKLFKSKTLYYDNEQPTFDEDIFNEIIKF